jgi:hypothetical protein
MSREKILAKAVLQFMCATYIPTKADAQMGKDLENMALEILKEPAPELPETPLSHETLIADGYSIGYSIASYNQTFYTKLNSMAIIEHKLPNGQKLS